MRRKGFLNCKQHRVYCTDEEREIIVEWLAAGGATPINAPVREPEPIVEMVLASRTTITTEEWKPKYQ